MANSTFICHKLIDDIVKRGGQQVSDRFIVKKCLNRQVLSNKKIISNELIKQTGIKSQYSTINQQMISEQQPFTIKKDQYMYKSLLKYNRKVNPKPKIVVQNRKYFSSSKIKRKNQNHQSDRTSKKLAMTSKTTFANSDKLTHRNQLIALDIENQIQIKLNREREKSIDAIRKKIDQDHKQQIENKIKKQEKQKQRLIAQKRQQRKFQKQINAGTNNHTYDINGKYMVYPQSLQQKALAKAFPISLSLAVQASPEKHCQKRKKVNEKEPVINTLGLFSNVNFQHTNQENQLTQKQHDRYQNRQTVFSNNKQRQTSSLQIVKVKAGVCLTEPAFGNSVRGDNDQEQFTTFSRQKVKSTFVKFFSSKIKPEQVQNQILHTKSNTVSKAQFYKDQDDHKHYKLFPKSRPKTSGTSGYEGTIRDINEVLLKKWIKTNK